MKAQFKSKERQGGHRRLRAFYLNVHLGIGLSAGAFFVIVGLTGSVLAFRVEIDNWLNQDLMKIDQPAGWKVDIARLDEIISGAQAVVPSGSVPIFVHFPNGSTSPMDVIFSDRSSHGHEKIYQVLLNPVGGGVIGRRVIDDMLDRFSEPFVILLMHFHYTLLQGEAGARFVGTIAIILFGSLVSGIYLWWPRNGKWRQAFLIKRAASTERLILDLHKTVGLYACLLLATILFSGIYLIFTEHVRALLDPISPVAEHMLPEGLNSEPPNGRAPIGAGAAVSIVDRLLPDGQLTSLQLPDGSSGVYVVGKRRDGEVNKTETRRLVAVDQYSGRILHLQDPLQFTAGERFLEWQYPLHTGEAFGDVGRAFICLMGFVPAALYATGVVRWLKKRREISRRSDWS